MSMEFIADEKTSEFTIDILTAESQIWAIDVFDYDSICKLSSKELPTVCKEMSQVGEEGDQNSGI